jgi:hypothetical protein
MANFDIDFTELQKEFGEFITGQINITYDLKQTFEQFVEVAEQGSLEGDTYDTEDFFEYVIDNVAEQIRNEVIYNGEKSLKREINLV